MQGDTLGRDLEHVLEFLAAAEFAKGSAATDYQRGYHVPQIKSHKAEMVTSNRKEGGWVSTSGKERYL